MNSSGIKRGLAVAAISALAVTGVPGAANAVTLATQQGNNSIELRNTPTASVKNDGVNRTVSLVATAGAVDGNNPAGNIDFVSFFNGAPNQGLTNRIGTAARSASGEFQLEWTPPVGAANATIYAVQSDSQGNPIANGVSDNEQLTLSSSINSLEITDADSVGYFVQPGGVYNSTNSVMGINGSTSAVGGAITVNAGESLGVVGGTVAVDPVSDPNATTTTFSGAVNLIPEGQNGSAIDSNANVADQVLAVLNVTGSNPVSGDAEGFNLYKQDIGGITAAAGQFNSATNTAPVTVTVTDTQGKPVAGALVNAVPESGTSPGTNGGNASGYTNGRGQVRFTGASVGAHRYYVDASGAAGFTNGVDFQASATVGAPRPESAVFSSKDGNAFDIDEFEIVNNSSDLRVLVKDGAGNPIVGEIFFYTYTYTPFDTVNPYGNGDVPDTQQVTTTRQAVTDADGYANLPLPTKNMFADPTKANTLDNGNPGGAVTVKGFINRDGTAPGQDAADLAIADATFKLGESSVDWDGSLIVDRQQGTTQSFTGSVSLADGTALPGRRLDVTLTRGNGANASLTDTQPAGTTRLTATSAAVTTGADGSFGVSVTDPAQPQAAETDVLNAKGTNTVGTAPNQKNGIGADADTNLSLGDLTINYALDATPTQVLLDGQFDNNADAFIERIDGAATPGRPVSFRVQVRSTQGILRGVPVTFKTDNGFFTNNPLANVPATDPTRDAGTGLKFAAAAKEGDKYGVWNNLGNTITVNTNAQGYATVTIAIERNAGFDDDGRVRSLVTATAGNATNSTPIAIDWSTIGTPVVVNNQVVNPVGALNPGSVEIVPNETVNTRNGVTLPDARAAQGAAAQTVAYDVFAKDQFGNLTSDSVTVSDDSGVANIQGQAGNGTLVVNSQFTSSNPQVIATSPGDATQTLSVTWAQASNTVTDSNALTAGVQAVRKTDATTQVTDSADAIKWYALDFAASTFTATTDPEGDVPVGDPVVETVTVLDQKGKPVPGLTVRFLRQGPGNDTTDGDPNNPITGVTNANGQAFYAFTGVQPGTARVSIVVTDTVQIKTLTDDVTIVGPNDDKKAVTAIIAGEDNGAKKDVIRFQVDDEAEGATVQLFKIKRKNGKRIEQELRSDIVPNGGELTFKIADKNGKRKTRYVARVGGTDLSLPAKSNVQKLR